MKLPALLVDGFDDCQLNFETLQNDLTSPGTTLPFLQLVSAGKVYIDGPFAVGYAGMPALGNTTTSTFTTHRTFTSAIAAGAPLTPGGLYVPIWSWNFSGTTWTITFANPYNGALGAGTLGVVVIGI